MPKLRNYYYDSGATEDYFEDACRHGNPFAECPKCDQDEHDLEGVDKCLNCGKYKGSSQLNQDQVCKKGCVNPNEY
jgi:hypothetical protein